jgi:DNA-binding HxlR family transcriptional regulator
MGMQDAPPATGAADPPQPRRPRRPGPDARDTAALDVVFSRVAAEVASRSLGPSAEARAGAALSFAVAEVKRRLADGGRAADAAPASHADHADAAGDLLLLLLLAAAAEPDDRKLRHLGALYGWALCDGSDLECAGRLLSLVRRLSHRQLLLVAVMHESGREPRFGLTLEPATRPEYDWLGDELAELADIGLVRLVRRRDGRPPEEIRLTERGRMLSEALGLSALPAAEKRAMRRQLRDAGR